MAKKIKPVSYVNEAQHYLFSVGWSEEDQCFISRVAEFPSLAAHGDTPEHALKEIQFVVSEVLKDLAAAQEEIPVPLGKRHFSGRLNVRMPAALHRQLATEAAQQGVSLNQVINFKLSASH